jgi:hypothetical protein
MGLLDVILKKIIDPNESITNQVQVICDQIKDEEQEKIQYPELMPKGPRVFLSLEVPGRYDKEIGFLTLEREDEETYVIVYLTLEKYKIKEKIEDTDSPKRRKVWVVSENTAEKIIRKFATTLKVIRGDK